MVKAHKVAAQIIATAVIGVGACLFSLQGAAASPDACALLGQAEVAAALGVAVGPGEHLMPTDTRFCSWHEQGNGQRRNVRVGVITDQQYHAGKTPISSLVVNTPEAGLGDEAYFSKAKGMVYNLTVKKGDRYFRVQARSNVDALAKANDAASDEEDKDIDRNIARAILKKL